MDWEKLAECVRMDLYADVCRVEVDDPCVVFRLWRGDVCWALAINQLDLWGLSTTERINKIVDAYRIAYGKLGV